jgi:hypothetical protein
MPTVPNMPSQAGTTGLFDNQLICAKFGICDQGAAQGEPTSVIPGSLLSLKPPPAASPPAPATPPPAGPHSAAPGESGAQ